MSRAELCVGATGFYSLSRGSFTSINGFMARYIAISHLVHIPCKYFIDAALQLSLRSDITRVPVQICIFNPVLTNHSNLVRDRKLNLEGDLVFNFTSSSPGGLRVGGNWQEE